jgi:NAD(P)-dependent dehydrogenase (short-subunit alcohol dehydrogenase family)
VVLLSSVAESPRPNWSAVASYASGLHGMTRNLALDLKPIRVNLVSPGAILTELWDSLPEEGRQLVIKRSGEKSFTGKIGMPEDVAEAYLWLMKDANVTGTVVTSDSGLKLA